MFTELKKEILKNGGLTCTAELKNANLKSGFVVSTIGYEYQTTDIDKAIQKAKEYQSIIQDKKGYYIGFWVDTQDNNTIYVDISKQLTSKREAEKTARKNKQLAYYDIKHNKSIYIDYEVKFYTLYKNIYNQLGELIDQKIIRQVDTIKELTSNERQDKYNYFVECGSCLLSELEN